jgi:beta-glucanase (GH16 family)
VLRTPILVAVCSIATMSGAVAATGVEPVVPPVSPTTTAVGPVQADSDPTCGGVRPQKPGGGLYTCTFTDDFDQKELDASKWTAVATSDFGFTTGLGVLSPDCYLRDPRNVGIRDGVLRLTSLVLAKPITCRTPHGSFRTRDTSGTVTTADKFDQTYGRFEFRARFPSNATSDYDSALWMYPSVQTYGKWPKSGEIDIAEWFGDGWGTNPVFPSLRYGGYKSAETTGRDCKVPTAGTAFNTYAVVWTETTLSYYYNDKMCFQHSWKPAAPLSPPKPFDHPFALVMTQTTGWFKPAGTTVTLEVDWVRAWK